MLGMSGISAGLCARIDHREATEDVLTKCPQIFGFAALMYEDLTRPSKAC